MIRLERVGRIGLATLDRPERLNALTRAMCVDYRAVLGRWAADPAIAAVVIQGAGDRAFCAGGDITALHAAGRANSPDWAGFFRDEYRMNHAIATFPKPHVALLDGVCMGGGVGLSIHGSARVATERVKFAMPETGIGLVPDVGATHALPRLPGEVGTWAGLTGARLDAADCVFAGIATHNVAADRLPALVDALAQSAEPVDAVLAAFHSDPGASPLADHHATIDAAFAHDSVEATVAALAAGDAWAREQGLTIAKMSPTSLKLTLSALRAGQGATVQDCLRREYRIVCAIQRGHDFYEGVRAQLIDRDRAPRWSPATLAEVSDAAVAAHDRAPEGGELTF